MQFRLFQREQRRTTQFCYRFANAGGPQDGHERQHLRITKTDIDQIDCFVGTRFANEDFRLKAIDAMVERLRGISPPLDLVALSAALEELAQESDQRRGANNA